MGNSFNFIFYMYESYTASPLQLGLRSSIGCEQNAMQNVMRK
jgi:hypothetical protein